MIQILKAHLNKLIDQKAKLHQVDKTRIKISYENYEFYYYVDFGKEIQKLKLDLS